MCVPAAYAIANGVYTDDDYKVEGTSTCWWWLRSPGYFQNGAALVSYGGVVFSYGSTVSNGYGGVRPAMWIDLDA